MKGQRLVLTEKEHIRSCVQVVPADEAVRRERVVGVTGLYAPPDAVLRRGGDPSTEMRRRQFAVWG